MESMEKIVVLDHGHVHYVDHMLSDLGVVNAARVSFDKESELVEDGTLKPADRKLIAYLAKNDHWTPFAHPQVTIRIKTPIFVRAQLGKHQIGLVMNEVSRRYVKSEAQFYLPRWRTAPEASIKQGSGGFLENALEIGDNNQLMRAVVDQAIDTYNTLLERGIAAEQARSVLPQSMFTEWWWTGSLAAYARICKQRLHPHAQWETQQYAKAISKIMARLFPVSWETLMQGINEEIHES